MPEPRVSMPLQEVVVAPSEPQRNRRDDERRFEELSWREQAEAMFKFNLAPIVEHWRGWSLIRLISIAIMYWIPELAHDWLLICADHHILPGWAFVVFVLGGFFLAVIVALGAKYIDKALAIIAAKVGVILANAPTPGGTPRVPTPPTAD